MIDLDSVGLHGSILLAGFSGGVCYVALQPGKPSIWGAVSGIIVSTMTSNYLSQLAIGYILPHSTTSGGTLEGGSAFIVGLCGPWICRALIRRARSWNWSDENRSSK